MPKNPSKTAANPAENAIAIALNFIAFLAQDEDRLNRFCALTGSGPSDLRRSLDSPDFLAMALDYALQDESLLTAFAGDQKINPLEIAASRRHLPGFGE